MVSGPVNSAFQVGRSIFMTPSRRSRYNRGDLLVGWIDYWKVETAVVRVGEGRGEARRGAVRIGEAREVRGRGGIGCITVSEGRLSESIGSVYAEYILCDAAMQRGTDTGSSARFGICTILGASRQKITTGRHPIQRRRDTAMIRRFVCSPHMSVS